MKWLAGWYRGTFDRGGYSRRVDHSYERWLELNQKVCANQARRLMRAACVPWQQSVLRKYAHKIHLEPYPKATHIPGRGMRVSTHWRALPCRGFEPDTYSEIERCPTSWKPMYAYQGRLKLLMAEDGFSAEQVRKVIYYLDTQHERAALAGRHQECTDRQRKEKTE